MRGHFLRASLAGAVGGGGDPWTPAEIDTYGWFDAADESTITLVDGRASAWADKSGNNGHATQNTAGSRPLFSATGWDGERPSLYFDGSRVMIHTVTCGGGHNSLFVVFNRRAAQTAFRGLIAIGPAGAFNSNGTCIFARTQDAANAVGTWIGSDRPSTFTAEVDAPCIASLDDKQGTANLEFWANGASAGSYAGNPFSQGSLHIGGFDTNQRVNADIAEIVATVGVTSTDQRQKLEGYLAHKWGLAANLPSDHPYKNAAPTV